MPATSLSRRAFLQSSAAAACALPAFAQGAQERRPNILFFFPDQHRHDWTQTIQPDAVRTPHLSALAGRGIDFRNCWCASPLCAPSRACLASGREYPRAKVASNNENFPLGDDTFYARLRGAGYSVLGCGKFDLNKAEHRWNLDGKYRIAEWGFSDGVNNPGKWDLFKSAATAAVDPYSKYLYDHDLAKMHLEDFAKRRSGAGEGYTATFPTPLPEEAYCDNWIAAQGLALVEAAPQDQPWFLQINFAGPHPPVDITERMDKGCRDLRPPAPNQNTQYSEEQNRLIRQNYSAMIENIDRWLGVYTDWLEKRGQLNSTLIVFSSDHGEMLGDHDLWGKTKPHQPSVGVPCVIAGPGVAQGETSQALVSLIDFGATFLESAGIDRSYGEGNSLWPVLRGERQHHREMLFSALGEWQTVRDDRYKLVSGYPAAGAVTLHDLEQDPWERQDCAAAHPARVEQLQKQLEAWRNLAGADST